MLRAGVECFECHRNKDPETHDILNDDKMVGQSLLVLGLAVSCSGMSDSLDSTDCNLPGSSVHRIFPAQILEWVAISFSKHKSTDQKLETAACIPCFSRDHACYFGQVT